MATLVYITMFMINQNVLRSMRTLIDEILLAPIPDVSRNQASLYGRKWFCLHEKLRPKMVNAFEPACVLLWCDFLAFIYYFFSLHICAQKAGTWDDHSGLFSWPIPSPLRQYKRIHEGRVKILIFFYFILSPFITKFYCSDVLCGYGCLRVYKTLSHFYRLPSLVENIKEDKRKKCWRRQNSTHL